MTRIREIPFAPKMPFTREDIDQTIPARFERIAALYADHVALTSNGRAWTYRDLNRQVNRIAHAIRKHAQAGSGCVAFMFDHSPEMVIATLAVLKAGKTYLGLHPGVPARALQDIVCAVGPDLILTSAQLEARVLELSGPACPVLKIDDIDERWPDENPKVTTTPDDLSTIFFTSGTTGQPKGVMKTHRAVLHRVWLSTQHDKITPSDRQSLLTHCSFSASEADIFATLLQGARLCLFDIASNGFAGFRRWLDEEQITLLHPPALLFRRFLATLDGENLFPSIRLVALAGDVVLPADLQKWKRLFAKSCSILHRFSTTETALLAVGRIESSSPMDFSIVPAGKPVADKSLVLVDETGKPVAQGEMGELVVSSRYLAQGYWRRPEETAAVFRPDPDAPKQQIYRTGDLGRFMPDGTLVFLGRRDSQVKIRGYRVDTREVESALMQLDQVREAAVIALKEDDEYRLVAFVVMKEDIQADPSSLREHLRAHLPDWKIPVQFESIRTLPVTFTGKVDRQQLEATARANVQHLSGATAPATLEEELAQIWKACLRLDAVGYDDSFVQLGGDSISMMIALDRIERQYGIRIAPAEFYQQGTIRHLADRIRVKSQQPAPQNTLWRTLSQLAGHILSKSPNVDVVLETPRLAQSSTLSSLPARKPEASIVEKQPPTEPIRIDNVSDAFLQALNDNDVDCIFINPGTDTAPILESIAKFRTMKQRTPDVILCLHESVAMAAAHGYFMLTGKPQVVLVHVDVGTQNIGANLHNAQRDRAGVVICAGRTPYTIDGSVPGARNVPTHWIQEQLNQASIVQGYVKWHYELTYHENLHFAVQRAFQISAAEPAGPVYLILPREVLLQKTETAVRELNRTTHTSTPAADPESLSKAAQWLIEATRPLILVAYAGRHVEAVAALVEFAELLAVPVVESRYRINFPSSHPLHLGYSAGRHLQQADCILILDNDVPWIPAQEAPSPKCRIIHVDTDPLKRNIPIWGFPVDLSIHADSGQAMSALTEEVQRRLTSEDRARIEARRACVTAENQALRTRLQERVADLAAQQPIAPEWAARCLSEVLDESTVVISEAVTNNPVLWKYLEQDTPGTYYQGQGSGLGWGLGAGLGARLAAPSKTIICVVGDGSWLFGSPIQVYWAAEQHRAPFLTVIFNNGEYAATIDAIRSVAPDGYARATGNYPACTLPKSPMYSKVAEALGLWARTVDDPAQVPRVLREALHEVRGGRLALVDICISSPRNIEP